MIDLWQHLGPVFDIREEVYPEMDVANLSLLATKRLVEYLLENTRSLHTEFRTFMSEDPVPIRSPKRLVEGIITGELIGAIGGEVAMSHCTIPELVFFFEEPGFITMNYAPGISWNPLRLVTLFEFFRMMRLLDPRITVRLSPYFFPPNWITRFDDTFKLYMTEHS